jgi:thiosulfate dehydrogenase
MTGGDAAKGATPCRPGRRALGAGLRAAVLVLGAIATVVLGPAGRAAAQEQDTMGFYKSYVFGVPDDPSEAWLLAYGGRLYDMWWAVLLEDPPEETHPAYPAAGDWPGPDSWRCVACHGWDYRGRDGVYAKGPHATGITGIQHMSGAAPGRIAAVLRDATHGYTEALIPDDAMAALALFVSKGQVPVARHIDPPSGWVHGDADRGRRLYQNLCAICHGFDGREWITGEEAALHSLRAVVRANPWRALHKTLNGQAYSDMPAMRAFDLQATLDVLAYAQTLPGD